MTENTENNKCTGPECERNVRSSELCATHYQQRWRSGDLSPIGTYKKPAKEGCDFPDCSRRHYALGYCQRHYLNRRAGRELKPIKADQEKKEQG
ncbi:hypothetical protein PV729_09255 [Streptomyces europaeiscabiei]|uniref:Vegetative protein n=1 Tax=Streptomyces europaeiscabiei TaxID=146819 RepID=A0ABU4NBX3_9ACTN|nr:hypothetical protein [Streptomyces europaeiscabiei]MDX3541616.1 hypothetical protein [Streptomyces europaeiscabiei]MDX3551957.1 hypothetical protein [Streptomyces europaeiscabiei]MDX3700196.1 hypothetical protein [Streptomyces europaeiscabiei]